ncbi:MAG: FAD-dependent oxidoreductase [Solirubrobacteraceae bacterium]
MTRRHTRREFVRGGAAAIAVASASGLLSGGVCAAAPPASTTEELRRRLRGSLVGPSDDGWGEARALRNPRLDLSPRAIAFCESASDVSEVVRFARRRGWPVSARGGRHSFAGYGNVVGAIVADVSRIDAVTLERDRPIVRVGGGANVLDVYRDLVLGGGMALPIGTCPTVGVSGLVLGGGFGRLMRRYGITSDSLRSATVVLADGRIVRCSETIRSDLFWALRGGGAGYAIVTEMRLDVRRPSDPIVFSLTFPWERAGAALNTWQRSLPQAGRELAYGRFRALCQPDGALTATASGHWYGPESALRTLLAPLLAVQPSRASIRRRAFAEAALPDATRRSPQGELSAAVARFPNYQRSDFFDELLSTQAIGALLARIEAWPGRGGHGHEGGVQLDALGAQINRPRPGATAFVHRGHRFHCAYLSFWGSADAPDRAAACAQWVRETHAALRPSASGAAYQNYIDPELAGSQQAYYGSNLQRLTAIKRRYDPSGRFDFAQGVRSA